MPFTHSICQSVLYIVVVSLPPPTWLTFTSICTLIIDQLIEWFIILYRLFSFKESPTLRCNKNNVLNTTLIDGAFWTRNFYHIVSTQLKMGVHSAYSIQLFSLFTQHQFTGIWGSTLVYTNEQKKHARITRTVIIIIKI